MLTTCPKLCGACTAACADKSLVHSFRTHPFTFTGACTTACADKSDGCIGWAANGKCDEDKLFMWPHCPYSCGICGTMDVFKSKAKDEI